MTRPVSWYTNINHHNDNTNNNKLLINLPESPFFTMLTMLGHHIGYHTQLFHRIIKLLQQYIKLLTREIFGKRSTRLD